MIRFMENLKVQGGGMLALAFAISAMPMRIIT
jgi:hypothetical protein